MEFSGAQGESLPHSRVGFQSSCAEMSYVFLCGGEDSGLISEELLGRHLWAGDSGFRLGLESCLALQQAFALPLDVGHLSWLCPSPFPSSSRGCQEAQKHMSTLLGAIT